MLAVPDQGADQERCHDEGCRRCGFRLISAIIRYDKALGPRTRGVDTGALVLRRPALGLLAGAPHPVDLACLFEQMIAPDALLAYPVDRPFYDIGTPSRLDGFAAYLARDPEPR